MSQRNFTNIAVCGKFHMLNYLPDLVGRGVVSRFYMSHKISTARALGLPTEIVRNFPAKEYLLRGYARIFNTIGYEATILALHRLWEAQVLRDWKVSEQLHFLAQGAAVRIAQRARTDGSRVLCEVVNTHPAHRLALMQAEAARWGLKPWRPSLLRREEFILEEVALADALLAPTQHVARSFRERGITQPIHVLPYAANVARFAPNPDQHLAPRGAPLRVVAVGQIGLRKGQLHLLEAASSFRGALALTLVGGIDDEIRPLLARYEGSFTHIPRVAPVEMPALLASHDLFVSASLEEGLAVSICEAMSMGLAVIATRESGAGEVLEDGVSGTLVNARDGGALRMALQAALDDRDRLAAFGQAALARTRNLVNWQSYAVALEAIYDAH